MLIHLTILISSLFLMYSRTFKYTYVIDDLEAARPKEQETKNVWKRAWEHLRGTKYTDNRLAHMITTFLHIINCVLIYFVFGHNTISFITALLFGFNPVGNQVSIWLSGKPYSNSAMLLLLGLLVIPLMPFIYGFCVWWAPNSIFFPLLFVIKQPHWYLILLPLIGFLFSRKFRRVYKSRLSNGQCGMIEIHPKKLILVFKTLGYYFRHCLIPYKIGMCHSYLHTFGLSDEETKTWWKLDRYFFLGVMVFLTAIYCLFHTTNPVAYGFLWFVFLTFQWCNFVIVNHPITERYVYLSSIGLMYCLSNLLINSPLLWVFLTFYIVRLLYFMPAYEDIKSFWKSNVDNFPDVAMAYNQYGLGLSEYGNIGTAIDVWIKGIQLRNNDFRLSYNLANIMLGTGNTAQACQFLKTAENTLVTTKGDKQFWIDNINKMKEEIKRRGFNYEYPFQGVAAGS